MVKLLQHLPPLVGAILPSHIQPLLSLIWPVAPLPRLVVLETPISRQLERSQV